MTGNVYDFKECMDFAESEKSNPIWEWTYQDFFEDFDQMGGRIGGPSPQQAMGRDRTILLRNGSTKTVDEKTSRYSSHSMFIEIWSNKEKEKPGWAIDPFKEIDYLAYMWVRDGKAMIIPYYELRKATKNNLERWIDEYGEKEVKNHGYTTVGIVVPVEDIWECIQEGSKITLPKRLAEQAEELTKH